MKRGDLCWLTCPSLFLSEVFLKSTWWQITHPQYSDPAKFISVFSYWLLYGNLLSYGSTQIVFPFIWPNKSYANSALRNPVLVHWILKLILRYLSVCLHSSRALQSPCIKRLLDFIALPHTIYFELQLEAVLYNVGPSTSSLPRSRHLFCKSFRAHRFCPILNNIAVAITAFLVSPYPPLILSNLWVSNIWK